MNIFSRIGEAFPRLAKEEHFSFARHTTIGCGGIAAAAVFPKALAELEETLAFLGREGIAHCLLGAGANVLPSDDPYEGVVVRISDRTLLCDGETIYAGGGVTGGALCRFARERNFSGFEPFTGIPMTVGGGVTMNAGVAEGHFADVVEKVVAVERGKRYLFSPAECAFSEKQSLFQGGIAVAGVYLRGKRMQRAQIEERSESFRAKRAHLPKGRSMGCTFVNPAGDSAGRLIELSGLKGYRIGGACVSAEHANFIINRGGSAEDVSRLIAHIAHTVKVRTGVTLKEEIRRLP